MVLDSKKFNILLNILYYLRTDKELNKEDSDFFFTYVNGDERLKIFNESAEKVSLEFKGFKDIDCAELEISDIDVTDESNKSEFDNLVGDIQKYDNIDLENIKSVKAKLGASKIDDADVKEFYLKIRKLVFTADESDGTENLNIEGNLGSNFNERTTEKKLELEVKGNCNVKSKIEKGNFKIKIVEEDSSLIFNGKEIIKAENDAINQERKKEKKNKKIENASIKEIVDAIFDQKGDVLFEIFNTLRESGKIQFREGKSTRVVPGFNDEFGKLYDGNKDSFDEVISAKLPEPKEEDYKNIKKGVRTRFIKMVKKSTIGKDSTLFGKKIKRYSREERAKNKLREMKNEVKKLKIDLKDKRLIFDNLEDEEIQGKLNEYNKGPKKDDANALVDDIKELMKSKFFAGLSAKLGVETEGDCMKKIEGLRGTEDHKKSMKIIDLFKIEDKANKINGGRLK